MRLIDADILEQKLLTIQKRVADKAGAELTWFKTGICVGLENAGQCVSKASTIDAVPVKHGKWIRERYTYCTCSICRTEFDKDFLYFTYRHNWQRPVYCPNCGAKMDGGEEDA